VEHELDVRPFKESFSLKHNKRHGQRSGTVGSRHSRTMRAHWMLLELGLDYQFHPMARVLENSYNEFKQSIRGIRFPFFSMGHSS